MAFYFTFCPHFGHFVLYRLPNVPRTVQHVGQIHTPGPVSDSCTSGSGGGFLAKWVVVWIAGLNRQ